MITDDPKGSFILTTLLNYPKITAVHAYSRKPLPEQSAKLQTIESKDSDSWPTLFPTSANPSIFFSALGTTRGQAGSLAAQRKIDHDLNLALANAAHAAGASVYVLISSSGASSSSMIPYSKMKGELEDAVQKIGFTHTVILRPGLIVGEREDRRVGEWVARRVAGLVGAVGGARWKDGWAQDADVIARAAVEAGVACLEGRREEAGGGGAGGTWIVDQKDIVRLGKKGEGGTAPAAS